MRTLCFLLLTLVSAAHAEEPELGGQESPKELLDQKCHTEVRDLCEKTSGINRDEERACIQQKMSELSKDCRRFVQRNLRKGKIESFAAPRN